MFALIRSMFFLSKAKKLFDLYKKEIVLSHYFIELKK